MKQLLELPAVYSLLMYSMLVLYHNPPGAYPLRKGDQANHPKPIMLKLGSFLDVTINSLT
jgi:hypothetical protein